MPSIQEMKEKLGPNYKCYTDEPRIKGRFIVGLCIICGRVTTREKEGLPLHRQLIWEEKQTPSRARKIHYNT